MTLFDLSNLILFLVSIISGIFVYLSGRNKQVNKKWFLFSMVAGIWALTLFGVTTASDSEVAMRIQYVLDVCAVFIPVLYLSFTYAFLKIKNTALMVVLYITSFFLALFSFTPYFKIGVTEIFDFFWVSPGKYYIISPLYFSLVIGYAICLLIYETYFNKVVSDERRLQVKYQLLATLVGFIGGATTFFPQLFNVFPVGNYFTSLYIVFVTYGIYKHALFNVKIIAAEFLAFFMTFVLFIRVALSQSRNDFLINSFVFITFLILGTLLIRSVLKEIENREKGERLARYLANANARLREIDKQKTDFVSIASHQLRSPIAAIKGYASLIVDGSYGNVPEKLQEPLHRVLESGQRIAIMVDDFLNITRIEQGRMTYNMVPQNICTLIETVIGELRVVAEEKGLTLAMSCDNKENYLVKVDEGKMKQIFSNLIDNSIKYTQEGSITVSISTLDPEHKVLVKIKDTGIGIAPEEIQNLFQKFNRASNANEANVLGTGLGLYIAREIMKAHQGWINVESEGVGKGSTFTVELPVCDEEPAQYVQKK